MNEKQKVIFKKIVKFLGIKLPIIIGVLAVLMVITLKIVERYPEPLRQGFEQYLSIAYQTNASIGSLDTAKFFPNIHLHAQDVTMHNQSNAAKIEMEVKSFEIKSPFWSVFIGGTRLDGLSVQSLSADAGFISPQRLVVDDLSIVTKDGPEQYGSFLIANGAYNDQKMVFETELDRVENGYKVKKEIPFSLRMGSAEINAQIQQKRGKVLLKNAVYTDRKNTTEAMNYIVMEDNIFQEDNPLGCMVTKVSAQNCNNYKEIQKGE